MKNGYDQFFKDARKVAQKQGSKGVRLQLDAHAEEPEMQIRRKLKMSTSKKNQRKSAPWAMICFSFIGLVGAIWGIQNYEKVEDILKRVEIQFIGSASAEASKETSAPGEKTAAADSHALKEESSPIHTEAQLDHLQKLNERKKELDAREEELNRLESELQTQRADLEKRLKDLEEMRTGISKILEDRVKADEQKVDTLVQLYTNMKAPQAAKVFETMDEDLAVEVLGRMKKKNAADIMNILKPEKAQVFSEMLAGYKRRSPASR